jgi:hypothetical protein
MRIASSSLNVPLRGKIVDLGRLRLLNDADDVGRIRHVAVMQEERRLALVRIDIEMVDTLGVQGRRAPLHAVDDITLFQKELGKVAAVLARHARDECRFSCRSPARTAN